MGFQILFTFVILLAILRLCIQFYKKSINSFFFLFFFIVWCIAIFLTWNVELLNNLGHLLGIERGANILVYFSLLFLFYYAFVTIIRLYKIEQEINILVKKDAVEDYFKNKQIKTP